MKLSISEPFRAAMGWLHTWLGVALAAILFAVFWTGTLTVFDKEIDQWMKPELRIAAAPNAPVDAAVLPRIAALDLAPASTVWVSPPRERIPAIRLLYDDAAGNSHEEMIHPATGEVLDLTDSHAGSEFFFRFHFMLHMPGNIGIYLVGLAAMGMMVLIVSGIVIHRKLIQDFFTFRPERQARRALLDFHNLTSLVALPFHFIIPFSGLLILASTYFPWSMAVPFGGDAAGLRAEQMGWGVRRIEPAGVAAPLVPSLDRPIRQATAIWAQREGGDVSTPDWAAIFNAKDARSYVVVERYFADKRVAIGPDHIAFDPRSAAVIGQFAPKPVQSATNWIEGLHWIQFDHWPLRWLYFIAGLAGCAMIASGLLYWIEARIRKNRRAQRHVVAVRAISIGSVTGIILATCVFFTMNRLLPHDLMLAGAHRHDLEIWAFFTSWLFSFIHAAARGEAAWAEQCRMIAALAVGAALLNWVTTQDFPAQMIATGVWSVAIMDAVLIGAGVMAWMTARRLMTRQQQRAHGAGTQEQPAE
jgi:uncharacterized iron-regulated membrane protein